MRALVIDASVAVKWYVEEAGSAEATTLVTERLFAPDLLLVEAGNVFWRKVRQGAMQVAQATEALRVLPSAFEQVLPAAELADRALALAVFLDHPVYDCIYLALAERLGAPLVTDDARLRARLEAARWPGEVVALR